MEAISQRERVSKMAKTMQKVTEVRIATDEVNCLAQIQRSSLSSLIASLRMKDVDKYERYRKDLVTNVKEFVHAADSYIYQSGNPAEG